MESYRFKCLKIVFRLLLCFVLLAITSGAQTVQTICPFNSTNGANPYAGLTLGNDGYFYGTTSRGGSSGCGTVFKMTTNGTLTRLVSFNGSNGAYPDAALKLGNDGNFYGTTSQGGITNYAFGPEGTVFKVTTNGTLTTLIFFNSNNGDGTHPQAGLTLGSDGNFYGTTLQGGSNGYGTVFIVTTNGTLTTLVSFNSSGGTGPRAALTLGPNGKFYGTTWGGGSGGGGGDGTIFQLTSNGTLTTLVSFSGTNGAHPYAALTLGTDGNFYGTTADGGSDYAGTVFQFTTNGTLTTLVSFNYYNGAFPFAALTLGSDCNLYGTTYYGGITNSTYPSGMGTVFRLLLPPVVRPTLTLQFWSGYPLLSVYGSLGDTYTIEYTTNLVVPNWTPILIVPNLSISPFQMIDPAGIGQSARFYRAVQSQ
jgi:uncharacterized repeat protein (TIGR03803 family)